MRTHTEYCDFPYTIFARVCTNLYAILISDNLKYVLLLSVTNYLLFSLILGCVTPETLPLHC